MADKTCEERIDSQLESRSIQIEELLEKIENDYENEDDHRQELNDLVLDISRYDCFKILLSTGGPADWVEVLVNKDDGYISSMRYHFQDWFDHAVRKVDSGTYLWDYIEDIVRNYSYD